MNSQYHEIEQLFELPAETLNIFPALVERIVFLIDQDFNHLIFLLYRLDINEKRLKEELAAQPINAGEVIANMIIERVKQKQESRQRFKSDSNEIPEDEKW